jgi:hypothetical protein
MTYLTLGWFPDGVVSLLTPRAPASIAVRQATLHKLSIKNQKTADSGIGKT